MPTLVNIPAFCNKSIFSFGLNNQSNVIMDKQAMITINEHYPDLIVHK